MKAQQVILVSSILAASALTRQRFVGFDGNPCADGAVALGAAEVDTDAGNMAPINVTGILLVEAGAAVAVGVEVQSDASGRVIPKAAGISNGYALDAASDAGELIRIVRGI